MVRHFVRVRPAPPRHGVFWLIRSTRADLPHLGWLRGFCQPGAMPGSVILQYHHTKVMAFQMGMIDD